jgi:hypothetical protein
VLMFLLSFVGNQQYVCSACWWVMHDNPVCDPELGGGLFSKKVWKICSRCKNSVEDIASIHLQLLRWDCCNIPLSFPLSVFYPQRPLFVFLCNHPMEQVSIHGNACPHIVAP